MRGLVPSVVNGPSGRLIPGIARDTAAGPLESGAMSTRGRFTKPIVKHGKPREDLARQGQRCNWPLTCQVEVHPNPTSGRGPNRVRLGSAFGSLTGVSP